MTACGNAPPPVVKVERVFVKPPIALLTCSPRPEIPPKDASGRTPPDKIGTLVEEFDEALADCKTKLKAIEKFYEDQ